MSGEKKSFGRNLKIKRSYATLQPLERSKGGARSFPPTLKKHADSFSIEFSRSRNEIQILIWILNRPETGEIQVIGEEEDKYMSKQNKVISIKAAKKKNSFTLFHIALSTVFFFLFNSASSIRGSCRTCARHFYSGL